MCCSRFKDMLVNTIGHRAAERALQLGLLFPPADALQVGIVDQVVPEDQVQSTSRSVMAQWLAIPGEKHREGPGLVADTASTPHSLMLLVRAEGSRRGLCACQERTAD